MNYYRTYQYKIRTSSSNYDRLDEVLDMCRILYNAALEERRSAWKMNRVSRSLYDQQAQFTQIRHKLLDWYNLSQYIGRGVLRRIDRSFKDFFRRVKQGEIPGYPRFQSKDRYSTIELNEVFPYMLKQGQVNSFIKIKGLPNLHIKGRLPEDKPKQLSITKKPTGWFVNITYLVDAKKYPETDEVIGIDFGIAKSLTVSKGEKIS